MTDQFAKLLNKDLIERIYDSLFLLVDDEALVTDFIQLYLEDKGFNNIMSLTQSEAAIDTIKNHPVDIVLLDLVMPKVSGFEILTQLRKHSQFQYLPVIVLTSSTDAQTKLRALELGATDFLAKPVDPSELVLRVRNCLTVRAYQTQLTYYDPLTCLPNRQLFIQRLTHIVSNNKSQPLSIFTICLDQHRRVHNTLGPLIADELLSAVAENLAATCQSADITERLGITDLTRMLARTAPDEFSLMLPSCEPDCCAQLAEKINRSLSHKYVVDDHEIFACVSIGIAFYPRDGESPNQLIKSASAASAYARKQGGNLYKFYSADIDTNDKKRLSLDTALRKALENNEFALVYQPKVDPSNGKVIGAEALLRWRRFGLNVSSPEVFISMAEENGLIVPIGEWAFNQACKQLSIWHHQGFSHLSMAVNVSAPQFYEPNFLNNLLKAKQTNNVNLNKITIEITESTLMGDAETLIEKLNVIKDFGVEISIDDFGTGYSSLSYLKRFPIDELKIDRSFIEDLPSSASDLSIVKAIVAMAESLQLRLVAEGVETEDQLNILQSLNCACVQGYYYSKPVSAEDFTRYLIHNQATQTTTQEPSAPDARINP